MMNTVIQLDGLSKTYGTGAGAVHAVRDVSLTLAENRIHGLLGRNGAGKTTLMQLLTGQEFATSGEIRVFGEHPLENARVLERVCFIKESQRYPDDFRVKHVLRSAPWFFAGWDAEFANQLVEQFRVPINRRMKKLSRGQLSAVGVIVGLASRAPLTFFDEPYLGLDAVARQLFYDTLLADVAEHPRTVVLSTHLIDEVSDLLEHIIVIDEGRILIDADAEDLRGTAIDVVGPRSVVEAFADGRDIVHMTAIGGLASATIAGLDAVGRAAATAAGLELAPVSLQQLVIRTTSGTTAAAQNGASA